MVTSPKTLLIVEDNPADTAHYLRLLEDAEHDFSDIECVATINDAYQRLISTPPDCCLVDFNLPDGSALSLLEKLNQSEGKVVCPIIVITGQKDTETAVKLIQQGAQDYLVKQNLNSEVLIKGIQHTIEAWLMKQELNRLALHDVLTGLVNRALFLDRLNQLFKENKRHDRHFALLFIDLDRFKSVNDTFGHDAGDALLKSVSKRLLSLIRNIDTAARLGGDEFAVILPDISQANAHKVAEKIVSGLTMQLQWQNHQIEISPSIGLATYPSRAKDYEELMRDADYALYRAKENGRGQYSAFDEGMALEAQSLYQLATALPTALASNEFNLAFQPIFSLKSQKVVAVEALLRWNFNDQWIAPEKIIELVLEKRLGQEFHVWLFKRALDQFKEWQLTDPKLILTLNLPANLCHEKSIADQLLTTAETTGISAENLTIEVTETQLMIDPEESKQHLQYLADHGIHISIDNFGSGFSSMQYLANLPCCHLLKIDKQFFTNLDTHPRNAQMIEGLTALAHILGLKVVAEGIESEAELSQAKKLGCDFAQGYYLGAPVITNSSFDSFCNESKAMGDTLTQTK